jgi:hypothetical protein
MGETVWQVPAPVAEQFLDPEQKVRVATTDQFVGRRRLLQKGLKSLQSRNFIGVILHGLGGSVRVVWLLVYLSGLWVMTQLFYMG